MNLHFIMNAQTSLSVLCLTRVEGIEFQISLIFIKQTNKHGFEASCAVFE